MSWSRKNSTLCLSSSARISATSPASREATPRFTLESSAPIVQVSGSTLMEPRVGDAARAAVVSGGVMCVPGLDVRILPIRSTKIDEPVVLRASRSRCACAASSQLVALVDLDLDAAGRDVAEQLAGQLALLRGIGDVVGKRRPRDEQRALDRELHRVDRRDRSRSGADAHEQAAPLQRIERAGEGVLADAVVDDRRAGAVGQLAHALRDVLAAVD